MIDLTRFNSPDDVRPYVRAPFKLGAFSYHTDGYVCVRALKNDDDQELTERNANVANAVSQFFDERELSTDKGFSKLPELEAITFEQCKHCDGTGKQGICPECDGSGVAVAENSFNEYEVPCMTCNETGRVKATAESEDCDWCNGAGEIEANGSNPVSCCGKHMSLRLAHKIAPLPNLRITFQKGMYVFKFDGGEGVLMPLNI